MMSSYVMENDRKCENCEKKPTYRVLGLGSRRQVDMAGVYSCRRCLTTVIEGVDPVSVVVRKL